MINDELKDLVKKYREEKKVPISFTLKESSLKELKKIAKDFEIPLSQLIDHTLWLFLQEYPKMQKEKEKMKKEFVGRKKK